MGILDDAIREHLELKRRHGADTTEVSQQEREILGNEAADGTSPATFAQAEAPAPDALGLEPQADDIALGIEPEPAPPVEPLAGSPLAETAEPTRPVEDLFPGTGELLAAASEHQRPAAQPPVAPALPRPAAVDADSDTVARSGARRLSDDELAAWRRRLSERADRLAAQRPGTPDDDAQASSTAAAQSPAQDPPPAYWSGTRTDDDAPAPAPAPAAAPKPAEPEPPVSGVPVDFFDAGDAGDAFSPELAPEPEVPDHDVLDDTPEFLEETPEHDRMWFEQRPPRDFDFG